MLVTQEEEKKGWSWLGFAFAPYYYAGYGNLKKGILYAVFGVFPLFGLIIAIMGGRNARKDLPIGKQKFSWGNVAIIVALTIVNAVAIQMAIENFKTDSTSNEVNIIKMSSLDMCPTSTVQEMVNSFISNPIWESDTTEDGIKFVNINGDITYNNEDVKALVQFIFSKNNETFKYNYFEMNGIAQDKSMANALLTKMCESTK